MVWYCGVTVKEITDKGVLFTDKDGNEQFASADRVIYACGSLIQRRYRQESGGRCLSVFVVTGDAKRARTVKRATYEGFARPWISFEVEN